MTYDPSIRPLNAPEARGDLVSDLIEVADEIRQIATDFGARPYRVFLIKTRWTGEEQGEGTESVIEEREILPTPKIKTMSSLARILQNVGMDEHGNISVEQISGLYQEWQLKGTNPDGSSLAANVNFYWEIRQDLAHSEATQPRRRFIPQDAPWWDATSCQWRVSLVKQHSERSNIGVVQD